MYLGMGMVLHMHMHIRPVSVLILVYSSFILVHVPQGTVLHMHCSIHSYLNSAVTCMNELKVQLLTKARNIFSFIT